MLLNGRICVDAGTVNCPCHLAEYGKCIVCSKLNISRLTGGQEHSSCPGEKDRGPVECNCHWQGVCIYNEYLQNNQCIKCPEKGLGDGVNICETETVGEKRPERLCKIQKIKWFDDDLAVMRIGVPHGMAEKAALPGSFVFVKPPGAESYFNFPVSVMKSDYEDAYLELAIKVNGPKSKALLEQSRNRYLGKSLINDSYGFVELRGVYRNGLLGVEKLKVQGTENVQECGAVRDAGDLDSGGVRGNFSVPRRVLCLTKGLGLAPVANYIRWTDGRDVIDIIADLEKINRSFAEYAIDRGAVASIKYDRLPLNLSWAEEEQYDAIIISASDYYQQNIYVPDEKKVLSNNNRMCCGEGVCGSCMHMEPDGTEHRMCKSCHCIF